MRLAYTGTARSTWEGLCAKAVEKAEVVEEEVLPAAAQGASVPEKPPKVQLVRYS